MRWDMRAFEWYFAKEQAMEDWLLSHPIVFLLIFIPLGLYALARTVRIARQFISKPLDNGKLSRGRGGSNERLGDAHRLNGSASSESAPLFSPKTAVLPWSVAWKLKN